MNFIAHIEGIIVYKDFLSINKNFKSSVNLTYDIGNEEKIKNYILTKSLTECIEQYVDNVLTNNNNASYITGPYGKGKSYLFLVLFYIFSEKKSKRIFENFRNKVLLFSPSLLKKIDYIEENKIYLLPIVINANTGDTLHDHFITAISSALERNGIRKDLDIPTSYSLALKFIKTWENDKDNEEIFKKCKSEISYSLEELKKGLKSGRSEYLTVFKGLFSCVTHGVEFKSWYDENFAKVYFETANKLLEKFRGLFVVFDEFGAFLDTPNNTLVRDLNAIQNFAEMCKKDKSSNSRLKLSEPSIHFVLVAHKELDAYNRDKNLNNAFQTIKGRFQKYDFARSFEDDFTSILSSIEIIDKETYNKNTRRYGKFLDKTKDLALFSDSEYKILQRRAFPFNPVALKCLVIISRSLGQNERTMFSFMASNVGSTFSNFIDCHSTQLVNLDYIYSYFEDVISLSKEYSELYVRFKSAYRMCRNEIEEQVLKAFIILKIASSSSVINVNRQSIALSIYNYDNEDFVEIYEAIDSLLERGIFKESVIDKELDFLPLLSLSLQEKLVKISCPLIKIENLLRFLSDVNSKKYYISNEYNFKYKMTRFFRVIFMASSLLKELDDFTPFLEEAKSDGIIINVYQDEDTDVKASYESLNNKVIDLPIVLNIIAKPFTENFKNKVMMLYKISKLFKSEIKLSENEKSGLSAYETVLKTEIQLFLKSLLSINDKNLCAVFERYYSSTIVFNNEQINRNVVTKTTLSSLSRVMTLILNSRENEISKYKETSQEYTIYKSFENTVKTENAKKFIEQLIDLFRKNTEFSVLLEDVTSVAFSHPYRIRKGILPLFMAYAISRVASNDDLKTVFLYNREKDVGLTSDNLIKAVENPYNYSLRFLSTGQEKLECLNKLSLMFLKDENYSLSFNEKLYKLQEGIRSYIYSLPSVCLHSSVSDNILGLTKEAIGFKDVFTKSNLNAYDVVFVDLLKCLDTDVVGLPLVVEEIKKEYVEKLNHLYEEEKLFVIQQLSPKSKSIKASFELFNSKHKNLNDIIFENDLLNVLNAFKKCSYSDLEALNLISSEMINTTLDDWNKAKKSRFEETIVKFVNVVKNFKDEDSNVIRNISNLSALGKTFYNNLLSEVNEYGSSLSNNEKVLALEMVLKEIRGI